MFKMKDRSTGVWTTMNPPKLPMALLRVPGNDEEEERKEKKKRRRWIDSRVSCSTKLYFSFFASPPFDSKLEKDKGMRMERSIDR